MARCQRGLSLSMLATHDYNNIITCTWSIWNNTHKKTITKSVQLQVQSTKCNRIMCIQYKEYNVIKNTVHNVQVSESPPQKRSGMARVLKGFHSFTCTVHTHTFIRNRNEPYLPLPSQPQLVLI